MAELYFHLFLSLGVFCELHLAITFTAIITTSSKGKCLTKEFSLFSYLMAILCPSLSYPIHSGPSLVCLMCRSHSVNFRFFFSFFPPEEVVPCVGIDSVCLWEEVSSESYYVNIMSQNPWKFILTGSLMTSLWEWNFMSR